MDHKIRKPGKRRSWKMTDEIAGVANRRANHLHASRHFLARRFDTLLSRSCIFSHPAH